jgi:DNA polymerase IV
MNANFGKAGSYYYWISLGIDERPVRARRRDNLLAGSDGLRRSGARTTAVVDKVRRHFETMGARGRTATLKVKFSDFELITRLQVGSRH